VEEFVQAVLREGKNACVQQIFWKAAIWKTNKVMEE
jgi:hypothetical protein